MTDDLRAAIARVLNQHSAENTSNTPDYILAQFLESSLAAFDAATQQRETWYGRDARPTLAAAERAAGQPVAWMVGDDPDSAATYNRSKRADAYDAARRWNCGITALTTVPGAPELAPAQAEPRTIPAHVQPATLSPHARERPMPDLLTCPHCGYADKDSWECNRGEEGDWEQVCHSCGEKFSASRYVYVAYASRPLTETKGTPDA